ncbi:MAG TPA: adenylate/guanylate cyclase domain-containing protein [Pseudonocardia sp.]|jgi:adenylate cyclase|nr:adenylate/guanylate cyclase domain-containing protein [Pseudonocardia sp.]
MIERAPESDRAWFVRFARFLAGSSRADVREDAPELQRRIEELLLGGPRRYSRNELTQITGMDRDVATRLWRSLGFAEVGDDEVVFTDGDLEALQRLHRLRAAGLIPSELENAVTRSVGAVMASLADWQIEMVYQLLDIGHTQVDEEQLLDIIGRITELERDMQAMIWRRHLAAAATRWLTMLPEDSDTRTLVIGFADVVGFKRAIRKLDADQLATLIEDFQGLVAEVVVNGRGRVIKTVGDEVMFVADDPSDSAEIALTVLERVARSTTLSELRIGLAAGPVVTRFGDVYGEPVNIAARLTSHGRPGRILVDRNLAAALENDERFQVRLRRPLHVRGYRHLYSWGLTRARRRSAPEPAASTDVHDPA